MCFKEPDDVPHYSGYAVFVYVSSFSPGILQQLVLQEIIIFWCLLGKSFLPPFSFQMYIQKQNRKQYFSQQLIFVPLSISLY